MLIFWLQVYKLPTDRIYATYFGGDDKSGLAPDTEARDIWLKFLPPGRVLPFGTKVCFTLFLFDLVYFFRVVVVRLGCVYCVDFGFPAKVD